MERVIRSLCVTLLLCLATFPLSAGEVVFTGSNIFIGRHIETLEDPHNVLTYEDVIHSDKFVQSKEETPNFGVSSSAFWVKFRVRNMTSSNIIYLDLAYPSIHDCALYEEGEVPALVQKLNAGDPFHKREVKHQDPVFRLDVPSGKSATFYLKIKEETQVVIPLALKSSLGLYESSLVNEIIMGAYVGILLVMALYNFFIFTSIRERSYLFYVLYIISIGLAQISITGYGFKLLWPSYPGFNKVAITLFSVSAGFFGVFFFRNFLPAKEKVPFLNRLLDGIMIIYGLALICELAGLNIYSYNLTNFAGVTVVIIAIIASAKMCANWYRPAIFFMAAWTTFFLGMVLFVLRNLNILPFNNFTSYTMQLGTAIEVVMLSFALADKINILKKEKETSQQAALEAAVEKEKLIREQNVVLELKVDERTSELKEANTELAGALTKLKEAQSQLIQSEKMASLGQLTAGIAHEINNPINFVSSNIKPLKRDIADLMEVLGEYDRIDRNEAPEIVTEKLDKVNRLKNELDVDYIKSELDLLLKGMEEGAGRTVEIVKGLKVFSRLDEADLNLININEGLESTLVILNYQLGSHIRVIRELGQIPNVECYGGKLNQAFMNILTNSIYAIQENPQENTEPTIWVKTWLKDDAHVAISIRDNGPGISDQVKEKMFEPFFTTKDVGIGTGLGLSIVFQIIEVHKGEIEVVTELGKGTNFIITLPVTRA